MNKSNVTTLRGRKDAAPTAPQTYTPQELHDRIVTELASLECAHAVLDTASEKFATFDGPPLGSAEMVMKRALMELHEIAGDVLRLAEVAS